MEHSGDTKARNKNTNMLPGYFILVTFALRLLGSAAYIRAIVRGQAKPNIISWFLWSVTPLIAFVAAVRSGAGIASLGTLALALSAVFVLAMALWRHAGVIKLDAANVACGVLAVAGIVVWQVTANPHAAIITAILADIASAIPTLRKIIAQPWTEYAPSYMLSGTAMIFALLTVKEWSFTSAAFLVYTLLVNFLTVGLIKYFIRKKRHLNRTTAEYSGQHI